MAVVLDAGDPESDRDPPPGLLRLEIHSRRAGVGGTHPGDRRGSVQQCLGEGRLAVV